MNIALETERKIACTELARIFAHLNCGNPTRAAIARQELVKTLDRASTIVARRAEY